MKQVTTLLLGLFVLAAWAPEAQAQQALGRPFVFFVDGVNPSIPIVGGPASVADPENPANPVLAFPGGNYANPALRWPTATGISAEANRAARDTVFMRLRVNAGTPAAHANLRLMLLDSESLNNNGRSDDDDIAWRLVWPIPDSLFDGKWHRVAIPLPPAGRVALAKARNDSTTTGSLLPANQRLGPYGKLWDYQGGYNPDGNAFITDATDGRYREFDWTKVQSFGFFWDQGSGPGGTVYVDDFYIGNRNTDLSAFRGAGAPYNGTVSVTQLPGSKVRISIAPQPSVGGYRVYAVQSAGANVAAPAEAQLLAALPANAASLSVDYTVFSPHPSVRNPTVTFAVTAVGASGVENTTAKYVSATVQNARPQGFVYPMSNAELDGLFNAFERRQFSTSFFEFNRATPFLMGPGLGTIDGPEKITGPADFSATIYIGYAVDPFAPNQTIMMVYANVTDDKLVFAGANAQEEPNSGQPWTYDRLALFMGTYRVNGNIGSSHISSVDGEDFATNFQPVVDATGTVKSVFPGIAKSTLFTRPLYRKKADGTGWEMIAAFYVSDLGQGRTVNFAPPGPTQLAFYPLILAADEQDGAGETYDARSSMVTSEKPNVNFGGPGWFNSPLQWPSVAFAGRNVSITANEPGAEALAFSLERNQPNPFGDRTAIRFSLPRTSPVHLEVFNVLGQRVATLVGGEVMTAGTHTVDLSGSGLSAGTYVCRLSAGQEVASRLITVVK